MQFDRILDKFSGNLPLFPLSKIVLFPGARLPLHIFEPRYRQMVQDAEENQGLIGMACLRERRNRTDTGNSPLHTVACLGQIRNLQQLPDGRYLLQLQGIQRIRIREELEVDKPYRVARVELVPDIINPLEPESVENLFQRAMDLFNQVLQNLADLPGSLISIQKNIPAGLLLDVLSYYLPVDSLIKQRLLEENVVHQRARLLLRILSELARITPDDETVRLRIFPKPCHN